jgi:DNA-binding protein YbaB
MEYTIFTLVVEINLQKMMKQAQEMQDKMTALQAKLETEERDGVSGGGMVKVRINGRKDAVARRGASSVSV